jgi:23S rRNA (guanine745-N1)-methyltransferase
VGGKFILVFPGEEHLFGLKAAIYEKPYKNTPADKELSGFKIVKEERLRYDIELSDKESIASLFLMTPYAYRTPPKNRERVLSLEKIDTECDFLIIVYEKREN